MSGEPIFPVPAAEHELIESLWLDAAYNVCHAQSASDDRVRRCREYMIATAVRLELDGVHFTHGDSERFNTTFNHGILLMSDVGDFSSVSLLMASAREWRKTFKTEIFSNVNVSRNQQPPQNLAGLLVGLRAGDYRFNDTGVCV
jgi:hypothetical protein